MTDLRMKKYETYKSSGIEWIGEVPEKWKPMRFKHFVNQITTPSTHPHKIALENIESKTGKFVSTDSEFEGNGVAFNVDDVVYGKLRPYLQKVWKAEFEGNAIGDFFVYRVKDNCLPSYLKYVMLSDNFTSAANGSTYGAKMPRVASEFIANSVWFLPSLSEQQAIASYLDYKVGQIDASVSAINTQIDDLKSYRQSIISEAVTKGLNPDAPMKDSGIEWIGKIPEGWKYQKTKYLFDIVSGTTPDSSNADYWDGDIPWITPADFKTEDHFVSEGKRHLTQKGYDSCGTKLVPQGSIIFSKRAPIGSVVLASNELCTNQGCLSCVSKENVESRYFYYAMSIFTDAYNMLGDGTTFKEISATTFSSFELPYPSKDEQLSIANYLDAKTSKIESAITSLEAQRDDLNALKQSIISEAVTGKIDVRDWKANNV